MYTDSIEIKLYDHRGNRKFATVEAEFEYELGSGAITWGGPDKWVPADPIEVYLLDVKFRGKSIKNEILKENRDYIYDMINEYLGG